LLNDLQKSGRLYDPATGTLCREYIDASNAEFGARLALRAVAKGLAAMREAA
jgi:hypothetical protein